MNHEDDFLVLGGHAYTSRLLLGTGKFSSADVMARAVAASGAQIVTVALRRFDRDRPNDALLAPLLGMKDVTLMPNTSGARNAEEAIQAARIARELCGSRLVKVEIHPNPRHLMPDPIETFEAARVLSADGWLVMPYIAPDPLLAKRLEEVGCASVMPLGAAIGSGQGLASAELLKIIIREARIPVIVDAGLRSPSQAAAALEMGCDAVLVNTAVADAEDPPAMAAAFAQAVVAGRRARLAGLMPVGTEAQASSPLTAFLQGGAHA
ncbi:MAG TPA: thiazole synthase [Kiritimatiellia bacterium]|nr:thiazole synthase [Kiritimatiellia bacterium]HRU70597.1 thiazole synthase [Kiritimatiellia bacterium]